MNTTRSLIVKNIFRVLSQQKNSSSIRFPCSTPQYSFSEGNKNFKENEESEKKESKSDSAQDQKKEENSEKVSSEEKPKESPKEEEKPVESFREKIRGSYPTVGKGVDFCVDAWKQTFPSQRTMHDIKKKKKKVGGGPKAADEELPEWKKGAIIKGKEEVQGGKSKLKEKLEQSSYYKSFVKSSQYQKYQEFSQASSEFREDLKDHLSNHPNAFVQTSLGLVVISLFS